MDPFTRMVTSVATVMHITRSGSFRAAMRDASTGFRTLNQQIKELERELGFLIFRRTSNGIVLTPEGEAVVEQGRAIEQSLNRIKRLGKTLTTRAEGEVAIATTEGLGTFWVGPRIRQFHMLHPKLGLRINPSMNIADMRRFDTDIAIQVVEPMIPEIKRSKVGTLHLLLAASPEYLAEHGTPRTVEELKKHQFVFHTNPQFSDRLTVEQAIGSRLPQNQFIVLRNSSAHYMTILNGAGLGFLPSYGFAVGAKVVPLTIPVRYTLDIWVCSHGDARSLPRVAAALDWLETVFDPKTYPWFRREFVHPNDFPKHLDQNKLREMVEPFIFKQ